jgi:hypothetical protein
MAQETAMRNIKRRRRIALGRTAESVSKVANGFLPQTGYILEKLPPVGRGMLAQEGAVEIEARSKMA